MSKDHVRIELATLLSLRNTVIDLALCKDFAI
jgi:hypothetical protein